MENTKKCRVCELVKTPLDFYKKKDSKDGLATICKSCQVKVATEWQKKNPEKKKIHSKKTNIKMRAKLREFHDSLKNKPCVDCRREYAPECMDWDHLPQFKKVSDVSLMHNKQKILEEIIKCRVSLC